jgi:hypothetical protein
VGRSGKEEGAASLKRPPGWLKNMTDRGQCADGEIYSGFEK